MALQWAQQEAREIPTTGDAAHQLPSIDHSAYTTSGVVSAAGSEVTIPHDDRFGATQVGTQALCGDESKVAASSDAIRGHNSDTIEIGSQLTYNLYLLDDAAIVRYVQGVGADVEQFEPHLVDRQEHLVSRLDQLREMEDGWLGSGSGIAPRDDHLTWLSEMIKRHYPCELPPPHTYPTPDGNIEMEWGEGDYCAILEVNLTLRSAYLYLSGDNDDDAEPPPIDLESAEGWRQIFDSVSASAV